MIRHSRGLRDRQYIAASLAKSDHLPSSSANMVSAPRPRAHVSAMRTARRVVVLVVPPIEELDLVGPVQVFSTATRLMGRGPRPLSGARGGRSFASSASHRAS